MRLRPLPGPSVGLCRVAISLKINVTEAAKPGPWPGCAPSPTSHAPFKVLLALAIISLALASNTREDDTDL